MTSWIRTLFLSALPLAIGFSLSKAEGAPGSAAKDLILAANERDELEIQFGGRRVLLYVFASAQFKPYVKELFSLEGENVLLDAPADHLHHHGLMYAVRVNGVNFWEETAQSGRQRPIKLLASRSSFTASGLPQAVFSQLIHWTGPGPANSVDSSSKPLLIETRTIAVTVDEKRRELALEWRADFELGAAVARVQISGSGYNGLGVRLTPSFNFVAQHRNSENRPYTIGGKWDVTPARWSAVTGPTAKDPTTVTLFGHSANAGRTFFFTMRDPFTYLSVTQNIEQQPLEYRSGDRFSIRYLLTVCSGSQTAEELNERLARWLQETK